MNYIIDHINFLRIDHLKRKQKLIEGIPLEFITKTLQFIYEKLKPLNKETYNAWNAMILSNLKMLITVKKGFSKKTEDSPVIFEEVKNIEIYPCFNDLIEQKINDEDDFMEDTKISQQVQILDFIANHNSAKALTTKVFELFAR